MLEPFIMSPHSKDAKSDRLLGTETVEPTSYTIISHNSIKEPQSVNPPQEEYPHKDPHVFTTKSVSTNGSHEEVCNSILTSKEHLAYCNSSSQGGIHRGKPSGVKLYSKRLAQSFYLNAEILMGNHPERCVMVTVTLSDHLSYYSEKDRKEASRRMSSWINNKSGLEYVFKGERQWCRVMGAQPKTGRIHWHLIVALDEDVASGVDHEAVRERHDYTTIGPYLKSIWKRMKKSGKKYGLGKVVEILPVESKEKCARYLAGHITEDSRNRAKRGQGKSNLKKVAYSQGWAEVTAENVYRMGTGIWKRGVEGFMKLAGVTEYNDLKKVLGPRWAYSNKDFIFFLGNQETA